MLLMVHCNPKSWHLKFERESSLDILVGRLFQSFSAAQQNGLPCFGSILPLAIGTSSTIFPLDLRECPVHFLRLINLQIIIRCHSVNSFKVIGKILKSMQYLVESQSRLRG